MKKALIALAAIALLTSWSCNREAGGLAQRRVITLEGTPEKRPYTPAIEAGNTLFVSGQIAVDTAVGKLVEGGIEEQARQALKNLKNVIEKADYTMENVVKCTVLLTDISSYAAMNQVYMEFFPKDPPARMAFAVKDLPMGALIEIDAIAVR